MDGTYVLAVPEPNRVVPTDGDPPASPDDRFFSPRHTAFSRFLAIDLQSNGSPHGEGQATLGVQQPISAAVEAAADLVVEVLRPHGVERS